MTGNSRATSKRELPPRWREQPPGEARDSREARAAALFRDELRPRTPSPELLEQIRTQPGPSRSRRAWFHLRWALAAGSVALGGVSFAAYRAVGYYNDVWRVPEVAPPALEQRAPARRHVEPAPAPVAALPSPLPTAAPRVVAPAPRKHALAETSEIAPPPREALDDETRSLGSALARLRRDRDAAGALAELDTHLDRFPEGTLAEEARLARADALLMLGRKDAALVALERLHLGRNKLGTELRLIRGELRLAKSCDAAMADFDGVLAVSPPAELAERALRGRAVCRARLGDEPGARADYAEYLRRFPEGRFAEEARARQ
jgi:hypothetical protein